MKTLVPTRPELAGHGLPVWDAYFLPRQDARPTDIPQGSTRLPLAALLAVRPQPFDEVSDASDVTQVSYDEDSQTADWVWAKSKSSTTPKTIDTPEGLVLVCNSD